jgi:hypothetical protein
LRHILVMHGLDGGGRKRSTEQDAAVLMEGGAGRGLGPRAGATSSISPARLRTACDRARNRGARADSGTLR